MLYHYERNVRLVETSSDRWRQHVDKICFHGNQNEIILSGRVKNGRVNLFGLSQKVNNAQPKRFVELTEEEPDEAGRNKFKRNTETNRILISCELQHYVLL